jgi:glycosyltransferase involved in cell wall biosynthesis
MPNTPLVTVITVTYNSAKYVADAIESVLCQSYDNLELIICDDCSSDETWEIVQRYHDQRIRAFRNPSNIGEYPNRNQALYLANGAYVIYIDGDDIMYPHGLEFMVKMLEAFPESGMAIARPWSNKFVYPVELTPRQAYLCQFFGQDIGGAGLERFFFRTPVLHAVGGFDVRYRAGDPYILHRIALTYSCLLINDNLVWWRQAPGQASEKVIQDHIDWVEALDYKREFLLHPECPLTPKEREVAFVNLYGGYIRMALYSAMRGRILHAVHLLTQKQLPLSAWKYVLTPLRRNYSVSGNNGHPMMTDWRRHPFAKVPPSLS